MNLGDSLVLINFDDDPMLTLGESVTRVVECEGAVRVESGDMPFGGDDFETEVDGMTGSLRLLPRRPRWVESRANGRITGARSDGVTVSFDVAPAILDAARRQCITITRYKR